VPDAAITSGYVYQTNSVPLLPRDFSFVGVVATYTLFDFGKRERTVKERRAQLEMAELAMQLTKAKVAGDVKSSYFEMQHSRRLSQLAYRKLNSVRVMEAGYRTVPVDDEIARENAEVEALQAELAYRQAFRRLQELTGAR